MKNSYTFTLVSATQNQLESTVSVIATISMHNTEVECTGIPLRDSITIKIAGNTNLQNTIIIIILLIAYLNCAILNHYVGTPSPPVNLQFIVDEYYDHFSTVRLGWDAPNDDSRVDCYQYQLINGTSITIYNTSYTSVTIPGVVYNKNITFLLHSRNCVGTSSPVIETIHIGRSIMCRTIPYIANLQALPLNNASIHSIQPIGIPIATRY